MQVIFNSFQKRFFESKLYFFELKIDSQKDYITDRYFYEFLSSSATFSSSIYQSSPKRLINASLTNL